MNEHDAPSETPAELPGEQEARVRHLLAQARHHEPMPATVAARLDSVLAGLADEEPHRPLAEAPIDLAARRRRRNASVMLASAAAVLVAGFGIGQVINGNSQGSDTAAEAGSSDRLTAGGKAEVSDDAGTDMSGGGAGAGTDGSGAEAPSVSDQSPVELRSGHLARDIVEQVRVRTPVVGFAALSAAGCPIPDPPPAMAEGDLFPAILDGEPSVLILLPAAGATRQAEVLSCADGKVLARTTVAVR